ncbi:hypothetical protein K7R09_24205 [Serratia ureilytica]|uniref:Lipoprotein n=1 Tax=Serratia ureilytica TaxID=300181 RepID=A0ABU0VR17_9GAMM|nr:hypothetical protein [Serratia ureilytica]MCU7064908.1 hypothetical protein [Serratia ureilytica]MDQ1811412.1 hypothetical protein [Serratia ureilytica]MDQ1840473.1 hypothetical protein [Serratia ureilytica]MDQ1863871.1 hypothetical protein [Serratia ureilytica]
MRFVNGVLAASAVVVLVGCAAPPPVTVVKTVEVKVPVAVSCVTTLPVKPAFKTEEQLKRESDYQVVNDLLADRLTRQGYELELEAVLSGCQSPGQ